jgi:hypothetical protein
MKSLVCLSISVISAAVAARWLFYTIPFVPPPSFGDLRVTEGFAAFQSGRTHGNLVVGGVYLACGHSQGLGPRTCYGIVPLVGIKEAKAYWYPHPARWPHSTTSVLMQLEVPPGNVVVSYASQSRRLAEASNSYSNK